MILRSRQLRTIARRWSHKKVLSWSHMDKPVAPSSMPVGRNPERDTPAKAGARVEGSRFRKLPTQVRLIPLPWPRQAIVLPLAAGFSLSLQMANLRGLRSFLISIQKEKRRPFSRA